MRAITHVVFDLDGTLIDSVPDLRDALDATLAAAGHRSLRLEEVAAIVGDGATMLVRRALACAGAPDVAASEVDRLTQRFLDRYEAHAADLTRPYPGVAATLAGLRDAGFVLGVCTNKPERVTHTILAALDLAQYFRAVVGGDTLAGIRKPDPRHLAAAVAGLGGTADAAVMVGDGANDVAAARGLGIPVILRAGGYGPVAAADLGADAVIHDFRELAGAIGRLAETIGTIGTGETRA